MKLNIVAIIIASISLTLTLFFNNKTEPKVVFVRSQVVFEQYAGMKEAMRVFQEKKASWQSNLDTLNADYQKAVSDYNLKSSQLSAAEKKELEIVLQRQYENVSKYAQLLEEKASNEDEALTKGVLNQIDEFIKQYSKGNGYKMVIGTTNSGNLLYGDDALDVTEELLEALNGSYKK